MQFEANPPTSRELLFSDFLFVGDSFALTLPRPGIGPRALTPHRQTSAVPQTTNTSNIHKALDAHLHFGAQLTLGLIFRGYNARDFPDVVIRPSFYLSILTYSGLGQNLARRSAPNAVNVGEAYGASLVLG